MLYKEAVCPVCDGRGFISHYTDNSVSSFGCAKCQDGVIWVPVTNGDLIRRCTNEQLTKVHNNLKNWAIYSGGENNRLLNDSLEDFLLWLDKATDDIDLQTIFDFVNKKDYTYPLTEVVEV